MRQAVVVVVAAVLFYSGWHSGGHVWRRLAAERKTYAAYTEYERKQAVMIALPLSGPPFDFYASHLVPGDRMYFNVPPGGYGAFYDLPGIVSAVGRYYLLPAVQVPTLKDATVVITWNTDPAALGVHFATQSQDALQPFYVSRLRTP